MGNGASEAQEGGDGESQAAQGQAMKVFLQKEVWLKSALIACRLLKGTGLPGADLVSGLMSEVVNLVITATKNVEQCGRLLQKVGHCHKKLENLDPAELGLLDVKKEMEELKTALKKACGFLKEYGHSSSCLGRVVLANSIKEEIEQCCTMLGDSMASITMRICLGSPRAMKSLIADARRAVQSRTLSDACYLNEWWENTMQMNTMPARVFLERLVESYDPQKCKLWLRPRGTLSYFDTNIRDEKPDLPLASELPDVPCMEGCKMELHSPLFLKHVVLPLVDEDRDGMVSKQDLMQLHLLAVEYVKLQNRGTLLPPACLDDLLITVYKAFDRSMLTSLSSEDVRMVTEALQVQDIICSYGISRMSLEYIQGTRSPTPTSRVFMLLADAGMGKSVFSSIVEKMLVARNSTLDSSHKRRIVSAQHFFKVHEARSQAKAMIRCLAHQLVERLPGMAAELSAVVGRHGAGASLSTTELFTEYLLHPLKKLADKQGQNLPSIVLLLDALDESDDGGHGWLPVLMLICNDFAKLPECVRIVLTSRPEARVEADVEGTCFKEWNPVPLEPSTQENMKDVKLVVQHRLLDLGREEGEHLDAEVLEVQKRSQGDVATSEGGVEGSHSKLDYQFDANDLPTGRVDMYKFMFDCVRNALRADRDKAYLWEILQERILPVLLVVREAPTLDELAWLSGVPKSSDVQEGLEFLELLFSQTQQQQGTLEFLQRVQRLPLPLNGVELLSLPQVEAEEYAVQCNAGRIIPFHKSVLDFLSSKKDPTDPLFVDAKVGLQLCAEACRLKDDQQWGSDIEKLSDCDYGAKNAIYHLAQAEDEDGLRERALDLRRWVLLANNKKLPNAFMSNVSDLLANVMDWGLDSDDELYSVYRWLRRDCLELVKYPKNVAQTALEVPASSKLYERARHICFAVEVVLGYKPPCKVPRSKYNQWPPALQVFRASESASAGIDDHKVNSVTFAPDGKTMASASTDNMVRTWDVATGKHMLIMKGHSKGVNSVAFDPDGKTLASGSEDQTVRTWDVATGKQVLVMGHTLEGHTLEGHTDVVSSVVFPPDGKTIASASLDKKVHVWDVATGKLRMKLIKGHSDGVKSVAFSPDGKTIASASLDKTVCIWDVAKGKQIKTMKKHSDGVSSVAFSPDGMTIASASEDKTVRVWNVATGNVLVMKGHSAGVNSAAFRSDGKTVASASCDKTVRVWNVAAGTQIMKLEEHSKVVSSVSFAPHGNTMASASWDNTVRTWDVGTVERNITMEGHSKMVTSVAFAPNGMTMASASGDNMVRTWDVAKGTQLQIMVGHEGLVNSIAYAPIGGIMASASEDTKVRTWDVVTGSRMRTMLGHSKGVSSVAFARDGKTLASGSADKTVRIWDVATGKPRMKPMEGHTDKVSSVAFSPDGLTIASASQDKTVRTWDVLREHK
eukprot:gene10737-17812_t